MKILRYYQREAVDAVWDHIRNAEGNPVVVLPTASGKSLFFAQLARDVVAWGGRAVFLSHVRELVQQVADHILEEDPLLPVGIYSAGLNSKEINQITVAGIQSACRNPEAFGKLNVIFVDEAHRIPPDGLGQYRTFIEAARSLNPALKVVGATATPFRTSTGPVATPDGILNHVCYEAHIKPLIAQGYLSKIISKATRSCKIDTSAFHVRAGEYVQEEVDAVMMDDDRVAFACIEILEKTIDTRKSVLIFASSVAHGQKIAEMLRGLDAPNGVAEVYGETESDERTDILHGFKAGRISYLVNCSVLTEGFDAPNVDCVVLLRPTASPGLYYQMTGRGFRIAPEKKDCLILDFGQNILRHGPVDQIDSTGRGGGSGKGEAPAKECPECQSVIAAGYGVCPDCGFTFPPRGTGHDKVSGEESILSEPVTMNVSRVEYNLHYNASKNSTTLKVTYWNADENLHSVDEWVCLQHQGFPRQKAETWWEQRTLDGCPSTVSEALQMTDKLKIPESITYEYEGKYKRITKYEGMHEPEQVPF